MYVADLSNIIEVSMRNGLLACEFSKFVQQHVQLILGREVAQSPIAEGLEGSIGYHRAQQVHILNEGRQIRIRVRNRFAGG